MFRVNKSGSYREEKPALLQSQDEALILNSFAELISPQYVLQ